MSGLFNGCSSGGELPPLSSEKKQYNVLIITLDTTRADRIGCYGYTAAETPNIDSLTKNGVMFKNCYSNVPLTLPAHSTIFTGRETIAHNVRNNGSYFLNQNETTMAEVFSQKGYTTHAVIAAFVLLSKFGLNQGFRYYDDSLSHSKGVNFMHTQIRADKVFEKFKDWLDKHHDETFFSWVHLYDPHRPYDAPGEIGKRFADQPYNGEIAYTDHYVGKILKELDDKGLRQKTLIVVVGDHGEAFGEHKEIGHGIFCYDESLRVPLIFHNPVLWDEGHVVGTRIRLLDLMPTILHLFRFPVPKDVQGRNMAHLLTGAQDDPKDTHHYFESMFAKEDMNWAPLTGIIVDNHKYISLPKPELYDLKKDPGETENLFKKENRLAKQLDKRLGEHIRSHAQSVDSKRKLTGSDKDNLKSLGYISSFSQEGQQAIDPKDGIKIVNDIMVVKARIDHGELDEAERLLKKLVQENPGDTAPPQAYEYFYDIHKARGHKEAAEQALKEGIQFFPHMLWIQLRLSTFYFDDDRLEESEGICHQILEQNPKYNQSNLLLARIYMKRDKPEEAVKHYANALSIEPNNATLKIDYAETLFKIGQEDQARTLVNQLSENKLLLNDPANVSIKSRIGFLLGKLGEFDKTIEMAADMTEKDRQSPPLLNQLGMAHFRKGNIPKALEAYDQALALDPKNPLTLNNLGTLYLTIARVKKDKNALSKAVEYLEQAEKIEPKNVATLNSLAVAASFNGQRDRALLYWERALEISPDYLDIYFNLGITYIQTGQKAKALKYLNICKNKYFSRLNSQQQQQLNSLLMEAGAK